MEGCENKIMWLLGSRLIVIVIIVVPFHPPSTVVLRCLLPPPPKNAATDRPTVCSSFFVLPHNLFCNHRNRRLQPVCLSLRESLILSGSPVLVRLVWTERTGVQSRLYFLSNSHAGLTQRLLFFLRSVY